jgi:hypothetical protein
MEKFTLFIVVGGLFLSGCATADNTNTGPKAAVSPSLAAQGTPPMGAATLASTSSPPPVSQVKSLPPTGGDVPRPGEIKGYAYTYKKDETKTVATFTAKLLPADNNLMLEAVRDVVERSYGDKITAAPRITGSGPSRSMRVASKDFDYLIVLVTDEGKDIRALIITQMEQADAP